MASNWYFARQGQQFGPVSSGQLREYAGTGQLLATDLIWKQGMTNWMAAATIPNLFPNAASPPPVSMTPGMQALAPPFVQSDHLLRNIGKWVWIAFSIGAGYGVFVLTAFWFSIVIDDWAVNKFGLKAENAGAALSILVAFCATMALSGHPYFALAVADSSAAFLLFAYVEPPLWKWLVVMAVIGGVILAETVHLIMRSHRHQEGMDSTGVVVTPWCNTWFRLLCAASCIALLLVGIKPLLADHPDVVLVKNSHPKNIESTTIGRAVDEFMDNPKWEGITGTDGNPYVNVSGRVTYQDKIVTAKFQFRLDRINKTCECTALEFNDIAQNKIIMLALLSKMYNEEKKKP